MKFNYYLKKINYKPVAGSIIFDSVNGIGLPTDSNAFLNDFDLSEKVVIEWHKLVSVIPFSKKKEIIYSLKN